MLENLLGAMATLWLQSGFVAACGLMMSRFVQGRSAALAATVLRATWIGVALCLFLSATSFGSLVSRRALWNVALPTASLQTVSAPTTVAPTTSAPMTNPTPETSVEPLPSTSPQTTISAAEPDFSNERALSSTRSSTKADDAALVQTPTPSAVATTSVASTSPQKPLSILNTLLALWLMGSAALLLWTAFCAWQMRRVVRTSTRIEDGAWRDQLRQLCAMLRVRQPLLLRSELARSPFLTGLWRPCIVLPRGDFGTSQRFVLLHELTHLQRGDLWWNSVSRVLCAFLWMQPLLWMLQRKSERIGEEVCDEAVVSHGESARQYAQCLLDLAQSWRPARGERVAGAGVVPLRSGLARRVQNILDPSRRRTMIVSRRARWMVGISTLGIVAASLCLVAVRANPTVVAQSSTRNVHLSSPESAVRSFAHAVSAKNFDEAARCVEGGAPFYERAWQERAKTVKSSVSVSDFKTKIVGTTAVATFHEIAMVPVNGKGEPKARLYTTTFSLRQSDGQWRIVSQFRGRLNSDSSPLRQIAEVIAPRIKTKLTAWAKNRGQASIVGRVVDDKGRAVGGALVNIIMNAEDFRREFGGDDELSQMEILNIAPQIKALLKRNVRAKADGTFRVGGLTSANYVVEAQPAPPKRGEKRVSFPSTGDYLVTAREGSSTRTPDLRLSRGGLVSVRVIDRATRKPLAGVEVRLNTIHNGHTQFSMIGTTDKNGHIWLNAPAGHSRVMPEFHFVKQLNGQYIVADSGFYLPIRKAGETSRRIYNAYDEGQTVQANPDRTSEVVFELRRSPASQSVSISAVRAATQTEELTKWAQGRGTATAVGRVLRDDGKPAARVAVWVQAQLKGALARGFAKSNVSPGFSVRSLPPSLQRMFQQTVWTQADGTFRVSGLTTASYHFLVKTETTSRGDSLLLLPSPWIAVNTPLVKVRERSSTRVPDIKMTRGALLDTRVVDLKGKPLPSVFVFAQPLRASDASPLSFPVTNPTGASCFVFQEARCSSIWAAMPPKTACASSKPTARCTT